ncbi:MAG: efflux RND transporter periplasmic adaptor subunit [Bryobacteraceae bacterium]
MKRRWKILLAVLGPVTIAAGVYASIQYAKRGVVIVQTGRVVRQDLSSIVTASGEIKPRNYVNIGANAFGRITGILVSEGDRVRKGQLLARLESVQPQAELNAQQAAIGSTQAESAASEAGLRVADENLHTLQAVIDRAKADGKRARTDLERVAQLQKEGLIATQEFDRAKAEEEALRAGVREAEARLVQAHAERQRVAAQLSASQKRITQAQANFTRIADVLQKHSVVAPLDGVVTNLPVRAGETVVVGIQNSPGSLIMTIADMSVITAEVKVDETDIVSVKLNQTADIAIDAMPNRTFKGHVIEIGNTAILRSTGLAASQSMISSQEAKDFKVVVALDDPPPDIRPGLSCTAKVTTATRDGAFTIPIQALTVRQRGDLDSKPAAAAQDPATEKTRKEELQGVFVVDGEKAVFRKVETGISGATEIEVLSGLREREEIVTGSYRIIRTLRNEARVKVDNKPAGAAAGR